MLSGYWVMRMFEEKYRPHSPIWVFFLSRFMRIWLPFAAVYLGVFLLYQVFGPPKSAEVLSGLWLVGVTTRQVDIIGISWSLDSEVQFYLMVPVMAAGLAMLYRHVGKPVASMLLLVLCGAVTVAGWYVYARFGLWTVFQHMPMFLAGALIWTLRAVPSGRQALISVLVFLLIAVWVVWTPDWRPFLLRAEGLLFNDHWFGMAWVSVLVPFVIWNVHQPGGKLDMHMGNFSYALYLVHWPAIVAMRSVMNPLTLIERALIAATAVLVSLLFYVLVDRNLERVRRIAIGHLRRTP
jgi:peptidoglycan/LPS O-acetylase OafA/YrhL